MTALTYAAATISDAAPVVAQMPTAAEPRQPAGARPGFLARFLARRRENRALAVGAARLAAASPHLLADIGLVGYLPDPTPPVFHVRA